MPNESLLPMTQVRAFTTIANELDEAAAEAEGASGAGPGHSNHSDH